jgi:hypothetical protein
MVGVRSMTEPNVLGNVSPAKFLFESGNTEIINLWRDEWNDGATISLMYENAASDDGQTFVVPAAHVFYLLSFTISKNSSAIQLSLQSNTSPDTATGGTTKARFYSEANNTSSTNPEPYDTCIKFVAGEYITPFQSPSGVNNVFFTGWGVLCDA